MHNPHTMYLIAKYRQADYLKEAENRRLVQMAKGHRSQESQEDGRLILNLAGRSAIVIALAVVLNIAA